jgi:PAS domain S-box-containing protein
LPFGKRISVSEAPVRVSIVEDEALIAMDLERRLRALGYVVVSTVATGQEALNEVASHRPDLVLMDIRLEGEMDGIDAALRIRNQYRTPVLFLTSHTDESTIQRAKLTSAFGYLAKPFAERELHAAMQFALHRAQLENELDRQRNWLNAVLDSIKDAVVATAPDGTVRFMNAAAERMTGVAEPDALGRKVEEVVRLETSAPDATCVAVSGRRTPVEVSASPIRSNGSVLGGVLALHDLTSTHAVRDALSRLASVVGSSDDAIIGLDPEGNVTDWNPAAERLFGYTKSEATGRALSFLSPAGDARGREMLEQLRTGATIRGTEALRVRADGSQVAVSISAAPIRNAQGGMAGISCIARDVTERKRAEAEIEQMNASLRQLSGDLLRLQDKERRRIARELHDSTAQVVAAISMQLARLDDPELSAAERKRTLSETIDMAQGCARELRSLSYLLHPPLLDDLGLACAMRTFVDGYTRRTGVRVTLDAPELDRLDPDLETAIFRIVQEALTNIHKHSESADAVVKLGRREGGLTLEVVDHGRGLQQEEISAPGVGILGMRERARQLGGQLEILDNGGGTTVRAFFPLSARP